MSSNLPRVALRAWNYLVQRASARPSAPGPASGAVVALLPFALERAVRQLRDEQRRLDAEADAATWADGAEAAQTCFEERARLETELVRTLDRWRVGGITEAEAVRRLASLHAPEEGPRSTRAA